MVLFMEGRFALALSSLTEEEKAAIRKELPLPDINWAEAEAKLRESIAINGACMTVIDFNAQRFDVEVSSESLRVTSLGGMSPGTPWDPRRPNRAQSDPY